MKYSDQAVKDQYNSLGKDYLLTEAFPLHQYCYFPSLVKFAGDLRGKRVIDLACGSGNSTRQIKAGCHPEAIVAIDISAESIKMAKDLDNDGIEYVVGDVATYDFSHFASFDVATAWFLLHYASTKEELSRMARNIFSSLKPGGKFVATIGNPMITDLIDEQLGVGYKVDRPDVEGSIRRFTYHLEDRVLGPFTTYHWQKTTYVEALLAAGFEDIQFCDPLITNAGLTSLSLEYWRNFIRNPYVLVLTAQKPA